MQEVTSGAMSLEPKRTASRCTTEVETGTCTFEIDEYSQKNGIGIGNFIRSATFTVGGYNWAIRFYPNGLTRGTRHYVIVHLELMSSNAQVRAHYYIRYVGREPAEKDSITWFPKGTNLFKSRDLTGGQYVPQHKGYLARTILERCFLHGDCIIIQCDLTVIRQSTFTEIVEPMEIPIPPSDIVMHFGKLLEDKKGSDITFLVAGQTFAAHKTVLAARSPIFMEEFYGSMKGETGTGFVKLDNMSPLVFRALLDFIYTDSLPLRIDALEHDYIYMIMDLLVAANRYAMDRLKLICQSILAKQLNVDTVATTVDLALSHNFNLLEEACIEYIASLSERDVAQVCATLNRSWPSFMFDVYDRRNSV